MFYIMLYLLVIMPKEFVCSLFVWLCTAILSLINLLKPILRYAFNQTHHIINSIDEMGLSVSISIFMYIYNSVFIEQLE